MKECISYGSRIYSLTQREIICGCFPCFYQHITLYKVYRVSVDKWAGRVLLNKLRGIALYEKVINLY
ncbi:hypothetical protein BMS3Bbin15_01553 [archaeon BMS3Bbin15]|nr:hypothetical protein BMS3Bbin15_01553 [archaeon BMS3Bbin15]